jgi:hypothetical protein
MNAYHLDRELPDGEENIIILAESPESAVRQAEQNTRKTHWKVVSEKPLKPGVLHHWIRR